MICVVDASVAVTWFVNGQWDLREDDVDPAMALLQAPTDGTVALLQPPQVLAELAAVLARLNPGDAPKDVADPANLDITWAEPTQALERAIDLATKLNHHLFDTLYFNELLNGKATQREDRRVQRCIRQARFPCSRRTIPSTGTGLPRSTGRRCRNQVITLQ
jgi:hypothetical protein